eukprot:s4461_g2.t2
MEMCYSIDFDHFMTDVDVCRTNFSIKPPEKIWRNAARSRSASEDTAAALFDNVRTNPRYDREAIARIPRTLRSRLRPLMDSGCLVLQTPARARDEAARRGRHNGDNFFVLFEAVVASRLAHWHKGIYLLAAKWERLGSDGSDALVGVNLAGQRTVPRHSAEIRQLQAQLPGKPVQCLVGGPVGPDRLLALVPFEGELLQPLPRLVHSVEGWLSGPTPKPRCFGRNSLMIVFSWRRALLQWMTVHMVVSAERSLASLEEDARRMQVTGEEAAEALASVWPKERPAGPAKHFDDIFYCDCTGRNAENEKVYRQEFTYADLNKHPDKKGKVDSAWQHDKPALRGCFRSLRRPFCRASRCVAVRHGLVLLVLSVAVARRDCIENSTDLLQCGQQCSRRPRDYPERCEHCVLSEQTNLRPLGAAVFQGHAVWSSDQLLSEVARGSWGLARAQGSDLSVPEGDSEERWSTLWQQRQVVPRTSDVESPSQPQPHSQSQQLRRREAQGLGRRMALITGGLGGLGMLAANELAIAGKDHVVATSRRQIFTLLCVCMPPALQQLMAAMQTTCPHYMVKADCSDGSVILDTIQAFCRPGLLAESAVTLGSIITATRSQLETMPDELVRPSLETLERIKKAEASEKVQFGADVTVEDAQEVRDREDEVVDLISKLKARVDGGGSGPAQLRAIQKTGSELAEQVQELGVRIKNITTTTTLALPQRRMGVESIIHAAGVLQDGLIVPNLQKAPEMWSIVYGVKAHGAWQLHQTTTAL